MPRITIDVSDEHMEWIGQRVAETQRTKSEVVRDALDAAAGGSVPASVQIHTDSFGPRILSAIEHLVHRYLIDHPSDTGTPDERLLEFRRRYNSGAENIDA